MVAKTTLHSSKGGAPASSPQPAASSRNKAVYVLVAVAVAVAILAGVLVPLHEKRARSSAAADASLPGPAGKVRIVDKPPVTTPAIELDSVATALAQANKVQAPTNATANATAAASAGAPSPSPAAPGGIVGLFSGLLGGGGQSMASAPTAASTITTRGWAALGGAGATFCQPRNGTELVQMVTHGPCTVIVLQPSATYNTTATINVTSTKVIVGNPVFLPTIQPVKGVHRLFDVYAGGRLDVRAAILIRGEAQRFDEGTLRVFAGTHARVFVGGAFSASWCIFTQHVPTLESFMADLNNPRNRLRLFGGFVLVLGGNVNFLGCIMYRFIPYGLPIINNIQIGRDILVLAGNCVLVGFYNMLANLFAASVNVGNSAAVLGGTLTWVGGGLVNTGVVNAHWGAGQLAFVGGGTMVTVGVANVGAFMAIMRAGFGQFGVGAGVLVHIGHPHPRIWGVASVFNAGQTHAVGAGVYHKTAGVIATTAINTFFAGAGGQSYVGTGDLTWIGSTAGRSVLTQSLSGVGGQFYNGAGDVNFVGNPVATVTLVRVRFMLGGEQFQGAGWVNWVNCRRFGVQLVDAFFGLGTNLFLGGGGVAFINSQSRTIRRIYFPRPKVPGAIWVAGTKVPAAGTQTSIIVTKDGVMPVNKTMHHHRLMGRHRRLQLQHKVQQRRRRLQEQQDPVTPVVATVTPPSHEVSRNTLLLIRSSFEEQLGGDASDVQQLMVALRGMDKIGELLDRLDAADSAAVASDTPPAQVSVPKGAECLVCGAAPVEQIGEGSCQVSDACTAAKPAEALLQAQAAAAATGTELPPVSGTTAELLALASAEGGKVEALPDLYYLWHEVGVYCRSTAGAGAGEGGGCVSEAQLKQGVKAWLAAAVGKDGGFSVAAASTAVPAAVAHLADQDLLDATHVAPPLEVGCTDGLRFNVYVTTVDDALQQPLLDAWAAAVRDPEPLRAAVAAAAGAAGAEEEEGAELCALTAARKAAVVYPPVERMEPFQPKGLGLVGPSVVVGSGAAIAPVDHVVRGQEYRVFLHNFPAGSPAEVRLVSASDALSVGGTLEGVPLTTVGSFDDDGVTELAWTVADDLPVGRYYVNVAAGPGSALFATSQPFSVLAAPLPGGARRLMRIG